MNPSRSVDPENEKVTPPSGARRISPERLKNFCIAALSSVGLDRVDAELSAEILVTTDMCGVFSHGTQHLRNYVNKIRAGGINSKAKPAIVSEGPAWALVDGHAAMGMVTAVMAMKTAMNKALASGVAYVGVRNSNHFGAAGYYASMALERDMLGIAMSNTDTAMTVLGGRTPLLGTNPLAYAVPAGQEWPVFLDIALSITASTKIHTAKRLGEKVPEGWLVDAEGLPTTTIGDWPLSGCILPMAGHKGYGLAILVEILSAVLTGAAFTSDVKGWITELPEPPGIGHSFIAIDIGQFMPIEEFKRRMDEMIRRIRTAPTAKGAEPILLPGEMEHEKRKRAKTEGIALPEVILASLEQLSQEVDLDFQSLVA